MALRPILVLSLLTFALVAGCSDGPKSGDLTPIPGALTVEGTSMNTFVPASGGATNPESGERICPPDPTMGSSPIPPCVAASSNYRVHIMSLPEPSGDGYTVVQVGGTIGERTLGPLTADAGGMWNGNWTRDMDETGMFTGLEVRMGDFAVATAGSASGSQAFVASPVLSNVAVTGSYKGRNLDLDVQGLPEGVEPGDFVGRFYTRGISGNLTLAESFPIIAGAQTLVTESADVGDYEEFHIHVGTSKIYVYQATL